MLLSFLTFLYSWSNFPVSCFYRHYSALVSYLQFSLFAASVKVTTFLLLNILFRWRRLLGISIVWVLGMIVAHLLQHSWRCSSAPVFLTLHICSCIPDVAHLFQHSWRCSSAPAFLTLLICSSIPDDVHLLQHSCRCSPAPAFLTLFICSSIPDVAHLLQYSWRCSSAPAFLTLLICSSIPDVVHWWRDESDRTNTNVDARTHCSPSQ